MKLSIPLCGFSACLLLLAAALSSPAMPAQPTGTFHDRPAVIPGRKHGCQVCSAGFVGSFKLRANWRMYTPVHMVRECLP